MKRAVDDGDSDLIGSALPDRSLDTLGLYCPIPIIKTAEAIGEMEPGQVLEVLSDDPGIII